MVMILAESVLITVEIRLSGVEDKIIRRHHIAGHVVGNCEGDKLAVARYLGKRFGVDLGAFARC